MGVGETTEAERAKAEVAEAAAAEAGVAEAAVSPAPGVPSEPRAGARDLEPRARGVRGVDPEPGPEARGRGPEAQGAGPEAAGPAPSPIKGSAPVGGEGLGGAREAEAAVPPSTGVPSNPLLIPGGGSSGAGAAATGGAAADGGGHLGKPSPSKARTRLRTNPRSAAEAGPTSSAWVGVARAGGGQRAVRAAVLLSR